MRLATAFAFILVALAAGPAFAQAAAPEPPVRVRGTVETFADHTLTVKARDGAAVSVVLAPDFKVRSVVKQTLADIKPGSKIGITSIKGADAARQAIEIHVFPASMAQVRVGQFPFDLAPGSLMTNAPVEQVRATGPGRVIKVTLNGKQWVFTVPPGTPIVTFGPGDPSLLKPGAAVFVIAQKRPDGSLTAASVTAEKNGVKPPM